MDRQGPSKPHTWYKYRGRVIGLLVAFIFALLWMTIGFGEALLIVIIAGIGYGIGAYFDGQIDLDEWFNFFMR